MDDSVLKILQKFKGENADISESQLNECEHLN